jgi:hypothetical protein
VRSVKCDLRPLAKCVSYLPTTTKSSKRLTAGGHYITLAGLLTIAHCKTYWFSESIQSKVLSKASTILKVIALQST